MSRWAGSYYGLGWFVRPAGAGVNAWHPGSLAGTSTLMVRRHDGFVWAVLFNSRDGNPDPADQIDPLIHAAVDSIKVWPEGAALFSPEPAATQAAPRR